MTKQTYFMSKDMVIAACALMAEGQHAKAGAFMLKASRDPQFTAMVEAMAAEQEAAKASVQAPSREDTMSAIASIVEGMADGVNDIDSLLDDLDYEPGEDPRDEPNEPDLGIPAAPAANGVNTDVEDSGNLETASAMSEATIRLHRAQANLRKLNSK